MFHQVSMVTASAALAAFPPAASAQSAADATAPPIAVRGCTVNVSTFPTSEAWYFPRWTQSRGVTLSFVNVGRLSATRVEVTLREGTETQTLVDKGSFAPGARIVHTFADDSGGASSDAVCHVVNVDFADGSSWHAGQNQRGTASR